MRTFSEGLERNAMQYVVFPQAGTTDTGTEVLPTVVEQHRVGLSTVGVENEHGMLVGVAVAVAVAVVVAVAVAVAVAVCAADTPAKTSSKAAVSTAHPISRFIVVFILDTTSEYF